MRSSKSKNEETIIARISSPLIRGLVAHYMTTPAYFLTTPEYNRANNADKVLIADDWHNEQHDIMVTLLIEFWYKTYPFLTLNYKRQEKIVIARIFTIIDEESVTILISWNGTKFRIEWWGDGVHGMLASIDITIYNVDSTLHRFARGAFQKGHNCEIYVHSSSDKLPPTPGTHKIAPTLTKPCNMIHLAREYHIVFRCEKIILSRTFTLPMGIYLLRAISDYIEIEILDIRPESISKRIRDSRYTSMHKLTTILHGSK